MCIKSEILINEQTGLISSAHCTLENGFEYSYNTMSRGGILMVADCRTTSTEPVGVISNYTPSTVEELETTVGKMIRLYTGHQIISIARDIDEFDEWFKKIV